MTKYKRLHFNFSMMREYENGFLKSLYKAIVMILGGKAILSPKYWNVQKNC